MEVVYCVPAMRKVVHHLYTNLEKIMRKLHLFEYKYMETLGSIHGIPAIVHENIRFN